MLMIRGQVIRDGCYHRSFSVATVALESTVVSCAQFRSRKWCWLNHGWEV